MMETHAITNMYPGTAKEPNMHTFQTDPSIGIGTVGSVVTIGIPGNLEAGESLPGQP